MQSGMDRSRGWKRRSDSVDYLLCEPAYARRRDDGDVIRTAVPSDRIIPARIDQNPCAHARRPMERMRHGWSMRSFHAAQQW